MANRLRSTREYFFERQLTRFVATPNCWKFVQAASSGAAVCTAHDGEPGRSDREDDAVATVLIIRASRGIGLETVKGALRAGHSVRALARSARRIPVDHPNLEKMAGDALEMGGSRRAILLFLMTWRADGRNQAFTSPASRGNPWSCGRANNELRRPKERAKMSILAPSGCYGGNEIETSFH